MDRPCIVCQENCPVSPKAIFTREYFITVRGGVFSVLKTNKPVVELEGNRLTPGRFATGDYYVKIAQQGWKQLIHVVDNTSSTITLDEGELRDIRTEPGSRIEIQVRLQRPYVDPKLCIGCGICEHECPVSGQRAIRVTAENESRSPERSLLLRNA